MPIKIERNLKILKRNAKLGEKKKKLDKKNGWKKYNHQKFFKMKFDYRIK